MDTQPPDDTGVPWQNFVTALADHGHRRLVVIEGEQSAALRHAGQLLRQLPPGDGLWVGHEADACETALTPVSAKHYPRFLGQELSILVWDGWAGTPPDAFAALSGTLRAGGVLIWLMPPLAQWPGFADPDYARTGLDQGGHHAFLARLAVLVGDDDSVVRVCAGDNRPPEFAWPAGAARQFQTGTTQEQQGLIGEIVRLGQGRRRRPLVITADRGRGKSAALGMAAARLLAAGRQRVLVTAPSADNIAAVFHHAGLELAGALASQTSTCLTTADGQELRFLGPQELLTQRPEAEVVMVDEAAALPAPWLKAILLGWPRVVFASTVHGYEGTGRGFALRFRQVLDRETPHWRAVSVREPVRWAENDPLERLIGRLFLLSADAPEPGSFVEGDVRVERWQPAQASEQILAEAFGLLVNAHYRTTPADLRQWLDDPSAITWRATVRGTTIGVLWASAEGGLPVALADEVAAGKRRLRGHLLAQSLANHGGVPAAATLNTLRVVRIAVTESARGLGVGRRLVQAAIEDCVQTGKDAVGTSFGGEPGLLSFWQRCGLRVVRVGLRQEASTGEFPLQMLLGTSGPGQELQEKLSRRFAKHWHWLIPGHWKRLQPDLLLAINEALPATATLDEDDRLDLAGFAFGFRGYELARPVLLALSASQGVARYLKRHADAGLWCRAVLQGWSWAQLRNEGYCLGQKDAEQRLRSLAGELLNNAAEL
ncbi:tRNA(Met) cytidine acetyltransferase TmcA [Marinobacter sp. VGCF2001]|uniref:tRNA(Met) cytidine acetyltransferase TmcA n=1 Tax=Marinobacter sp. VGCF2001 TaxID=3417189 RepID=UPI003CF87E4E